MNDSELQRLTDFLWPLGDSVESQQVHWLLDGARDPAIEKILRAGGLDHACLYAGELHPRLRAAAPHLVHLAPRSPTTDRLLRAGWGKAWGILTIADTAVSLAQLRLHLKKFLRVETEQGKQLAFRFYDPRVLNIYLPSCTAGEFRTFMGPMAGVVVETEGGDEARTFSVGEDGLMQDRVSFRRSGACVDSASVQK